MKALSILQPWAWLIVHGHKNIENRRWSTRERGRILVHAGKSYSRFEHDVGVLTDLFEGPDLFTGIQFPRYEDMPRGCIVGSVEIVDCVLHHSSPWKDPHSWGFVLANAAPCEPRPYRGQLGFFEVADV